MSNNDFYQQVYEVAKLIPRGRVSSYGAIAAYLGTKSSSRLVGYAMNNAPTDVPAHRVVNRNGLLTGKAHFEHPDRMKELLEWEGIKVKDDQVQNFEKVFWNPEAELGIIL